MIGGIVEYESVVYFLGSKKFFRLATQVVCSKRASAVRGQRHCFESIWFKHVLETNMFNKNSTPPIWVQFIVVDRKMSLLDSAAASVNDNTGHA